MASLALAVGQTIELNDGRHAVVRFVGATGFAPGEWVGVELDEATGKNDGSVKGERYFDCHANHGMFLRAQGVNRIVSRPSTRPTSIHLPAVDPARAASALPSPVKSPTKITRTATPTGSQQTRNPTPPTAATAATATARRPPSTAAAAKPRTASTLSTAARRSSTVPSSSSAAAAQTPRSSATTAPASSRLTARNTSLQKALTPAARQPPAPARQTPATARRLSSAPKQPQPQDSPSPRQSPSLAPPDEPQDAPPAEHAPQSFAPKPATSPAASHSSQRPAKTTAREVEDLQTKMRIMERKRQEDRDALKKMQNVEQERDRYANVVQKMQSKMQAQSLELTDLRAQLKDSESRLIDIEAIQAEHDAVVEMATLDREMAEETAESLKTEVEALRTSNEEMRLELDILKEENEELGREMNPEERTSQGWLQLERSNERLREALLRLRDMTQEQEADLKAQIGGLEEEVKDFGLLKHDYEETREKLLATEADLDDIRQQLDAAMGAEDMIEELTERNMTLQEKIDHLELVIEDLENLKELNDELEINHVEAEKQMQEEIDFKDTIIGEQSRRSAQQQQAIEDCEYTISRFRELVTNLQADLEDMRASRQITETEAEELSSRSRAMMDLNMKLQMSAAKTQIKTIDLELRRLEAEEAAEHLAIVQLFLPDAFHSERDSILALLRFKRVGFKSRLLNNLIKERLNGQGTQIADEDIFDAYSVLDRLAWVAEMSDRFVDDIRSCSVEEFAKYESALYELEPVERALNTYIDSIKRDDMKEGRVDEELQRSMAVMSHLATLHIKDSVAASASDMLMQASLIQSHLDNTSSSLGLCRSMVQSNVSTSQPDSESDEPNLFTQLDDIIASIRSARVVVNKTHRNVIDLQSRSLALNPSYLELISSAESLTTKLAVFGRRAGERLQSLFGEEGREESISVDETELLLTRLSASIFGSGSAEASPFASLFTYLASLSTQLTELGDISSNLENTQEFERAVEPWVTRSANLRAIKLTSVDTEAEVARLTEVVRERSLLVRSKESELEEQSVRIEMLEARMAEASKRSSALADLETNIAALQKEKATHQTALSDAESKVSRLRKERDEWRKSAEENKPDPTATNTTATEMGGASRMELDRAKLRIDSLESAIRYLQQQFSRPQTISGHSSGLEWLEQPLIPKLSRRLQKQKTLQAEGKTAFSELLKLVTDAEPVALTNATANRLAWRPAAQTARWNAQKKKEDWAIWQDWERDLLDRVEDKPGRKIVRPLKETGIAGANEPVVIVAEHGP